MATSLKYMGMGGLVKNQQKEKEKEAGSSKDGEAEAWKAAAKGGMPNWVNFGRTGESAAQRERKKSVVEEAEAQDDKAIRFTISGVNQRMTKEDFIREMQKLDKSTRKEVVDQSTASNRVKTLAKQDPAPGAASSSPSRAAGAKHITVSKPAVQFDGQEDESGSSSSHRQGRAPRRKSPSISPEISPGRSASDEEPSQDEPETAVERRRRLAVLKSVEGDDNDESNETPAERRRREAALGVSGGDRDSDSDDDDTPRVPPARRGIRFAEPERGRK